MWICLPALSASVSSVFDPSLTLDLILPLSVPGPDPLSLIGFLVSSTLQSLSYSGTNTPLPVIPAHLCFDLTAPGQHQQSTD